jgi:hypothetical protein
MKSKYYEENKSVFKEKNSNYYEENKSSFKEKNSKYYEQHKYSSKRKFTNELSEYNTKLCDKTINKNDNIDRMNQNNLNDEFEAEVKSFQEIKPIESKRNKINLAKNYENSIESCSVDSDSDSNNNDDNDILDDDIQIGVNNVDNDDDTIDEVLKCNLNIFIINFKI